MKGLHNYEMINRWKQWILTWCVKHRGQLVLFLNVKLSSTCSILQIFKEGKLTWSRNKAILPIIGSNTIIINCIMMTSNFGHCVQSDWRVRKGWCWGGRLDLWNFGRRNSSYVDLKLAINQMKQQNKRGEIKITYHSGAHGCED